MNSFNFDLSYQPYDSNRFSIISSNGMVASSNALASEAGLDMLKKGGNAIDAAIATAAMLTIVEPTSNGIGGDLFAIVWYKNKLHGLNGSGYSPYSISREKLIESGYKKMPSRGWIPITVPGQPKAWASLNEKFANLSLLENLLPAIKYANEGYYLSPTVGYLWNKYFKKEIVKYKNNNIFNEWVKTFTNEGNAYNCGDKVILKNHAKTLELIGKSNAKEFYEGEIAEKICMQSIRDGGYIRKEDLENYDVEWTEPISINYGGFDIWELPPNGQGLVTLESLNILKNFEITNDSLSVHRQIEAIKKSFIDIKENITDPKKITDGWKKLLDVDYGIKASKNIKVKANNNYDYDLLKDGTVYLCSADKDGNMVSLIQSNFRDFGSGIVIEDYGIAMQNRGYSFSLDKDDDINRLEAHKRPYHTLMPGFITKDGEGIGPFGVMGGYMQPQGHLQVINNLINLKLNPQMALDSPRWQLKEENKILLEPKFDKNIAKDLINRGHKVEYADNFYSFGRGQIILKDKRGFYIGGTESRTDSNISCY